MSLISLLLCAGLLALFRAREIRAAVLVSSTVLLLGVSFPAASHEDIGLQLEEVNAQLVKIPGDYRLHAKRGELHAQHSNWQLSLASYQRAQAQAPRDVAEVLDLRIAETLYLSGDPDAAVPYLNRYLIAHEKSSAGWRIHAQVMASLHRTDAALVSFTRAIESAKFPTPDLFFERARLLEHLPNRADELLVGIEEGIQSLGPLMALLEYAIDIECQRKNFAGALARMDALPEPIQQQPRWLLRRSLVLKKMGYRAEAENVNRLALQAIENLPAQRRSTQAYVSLRGEIENEYTAMTDGPAT